MDEEELERIRRKKLEELRQRQEEEQEQEEAVNQAKTYIERALRQVLEPDAWDKWNNARFANEQTAYAAAQIILKSIQSGQMSPKVDLETLRSILSKVSSMTRKDFTIKRR